MSRNSADMKKFKSQVKMQMDLNESEGQVALSERRKTQIKWCREQRVKLMEGYDDLFQVRLSLDNLDERLHKESHWIQEMKKGIMQRMNNMTEMDFTNMPSRSSFFEEDFDVSKSNVNVHNSEDDTNEKQNDNSSTDQNDQDNNRHRNDSPCLATCFTNNDDVEQDDDLDDDDESDESEAVENQSTKIKAS